MAPARASYKNQVAKFEEMLGTCSYCLRPLSGGGSWVKYYLFLPAIVLLLLLPSCFAGD